MNKLRLLIASTLAIVASLYAVLTPVDALEEGGAIKQDWIVDIKTEELKDYFKYKGAKFNNVVRASVNYREGSAPKKTKSLHYEDLWYGQSKPLGLERYKSLEGINRNSFEIHISHRSDAVSTAEAWASANATLRVMLDIYKRASSVGAVYVPARSFYAVAYAFQQQGFQPLPDAVADQAIDGGRILVQMVSEPDGMSQSLSY